MKNRCRIFENKYHLSSDEFYKLFQDGKMGDEEDFFEWKALIEGMKEWAYTNEVRNKKKQESRGLNYEQGISVSSQNFKVNYRRRIPNSHKSNKRIKLKSGRQHANF